jgi:tellurite resistance protein TehA-like permease
MGLMRRRGVGWSGVVMRVHRLQNPLEHWLSGLLFEIAAFAVFITVVCAITALIVMLG